MDTTEQLNGTYFYGGLTNLSPGELFFWIMIDVTAEHFTGAKDVISAAALYAGQNSIAVPGKLGGAMSGTSWLSVQSRKLLNNYHLPFRVPTLVSKRENVFAIRVQMTHKLGSFVGRTIPVIGWVVLGVDVAQITWEATVRYNRIVNKGDRLW